MNKTISINPPPIDKKCMCCAKSVNELVPFGGMGDPLVGNFRGQLLVKIFRPMAPVSAEAEAKIASIKDWDKFEKENSKEADALNLYEQASNTIGASWECRDCIILDDDAYFTTKFGEVKKNEPNNS